MKSDLSSDKPLWPLSCYGPAKFEPNIISGLDESMEELRVRAALALIAGNSNEYVSPDPLFRLSQSITKIRYHMKPAEYKLRTKPSQ